MNSRFSFNKAIRLRTRREYKRMVHYDTRHVGRYVIFDVKSNQREFSRLGITVTKRYGKSHLRNRFKRIVREAFRLKKEFIKPSLDILVKPRSEALHAGSSDIINEFLKFLEANN